MQTVASAKLFKASNLFSKLMWFQPVVRPLVYCYGAQSNYRLMNCRQPYFHLLPPYGNVFGSPLDPQIVDRLHLLMPYCTYSAFNSRLSVLRMETSDSNATSARAAHASGKRMRVVDQTEGEPQVLEEETAPDVNGSDQNIKQVEMEDTQGVWQHSVDCFPSDVTLHESLQPDEDKKRMLEAEAEACCQFIEQQRQWQYTAYGRRLREHPQQGLEFSLLSYNILSQELLEMNYGLYKHCDEDVLNWEYRCKNLLREIKDLGADIICLQEMQEDHYLEVFKPELEKLGFASLYKKRTGSKPDGCAIFYRTTLFSLDDQASVEFCKPELSILNRDNIGIVAMLKPTSTDGDVKLCVATTHLLFNPRRGDIKLAQLRYLLAEIDKLAFKYNHNGKPSYHPVLLCGDMNSEPYSPLYRFLTGGRLNYDGLLSGDVSGQPEGFRRGRMIMEDELVSAELGITEDSRYVEEQRCRNEDAEPERQPSLPFTTNATDVIAATPEQCICFDLPDGSRVEETASPDFHVVEVLPALLDLEDEERQSPNAPTISHHLNLQSAYRHKTQSGEREVTTHHMKASSTVDYIFYSSENRAPRKRGMDDDASNEDALRLLGRYRLPASSHVQAMNGLPNAFLSSDHLALVAKFLLKQQ